MGNGLLWNAMVRVIGCTAFISCIPYMYHKTYAPPLNFQLRVPVGLIKLCPRPTWMTHCLNTKRASRFRYKDNSVSAAGGALLSIRVK